MIWEEGEAKPSKGIYENDMGRVGGGVEGEAKPSKWIYEIGMGRGGMRTKLNQVK